MPFTRAPLPESAHRLNEITRDEDIRYGFTYAFCWPNGSPAAISITFDDARPSQVDVGVPILDQYGVRGTFYVIKANVEKRLDAWRAAFARGHECGNHTQTHPCSGNFPGPRSIGNSLEEYTLERMQHELDSADAEIVELLRTKPLTFAYPCGQKFVGRGEGVRSYVPLIANRFLVGRSAFDQVFNHPLRCDLAQVHGIDADRTGFDRLRQVIETAMNSQGWAVFVGHEMGQNDARQIFRVDVLHQLCEFCRNHKIWIDTVANVGAHVRQSRGQ